MSTYPVVFDDGSKAMVPAEKLAGALKDGGKVAQAMQFDDGSKAYVPLEKVHDAIHDGGTPIGYTPKSGTGAPPDNPVSSAPSQDDSVGGLIKGAAKNLYQVSAPGIAVSLLKKQAPSLASKLPAAMLDNAAPAEKLPGQIVMNAAPMMVGDEVPLSERPSVEPAPAPKPASGATDSLLSRVGEVAKRRISDNFVVKAAKDLNYIARGDTAPTAPTVSPTPEPVPTTNGVPWGQGKFETPLDKFGAKIEPTPKEVPAGQFSFQADAKSLEALKQATGSVVDQAVPTSTNRGVNLTTKAQIDMKLRNGDVEGAEQVLDQAAKKANPSYAAPDRPQIVPATQNIRENDALASAADNVKQQRGYQASRDDAATAQEANWNLEKHGYRAESEARREFIARNSTGTTKGEMAQQVTTKPVDPSSLSLEEKLRIMLEAARAAKQ